MMIVVMSSNRTSHLLRGFFHQWSKYENDLDALASTKMVITETEEPPTLWPPGWCIYYAGHDHPGQNWVGHLLKGLDWTHDEKFVLLLMDDYWLCQHVDHKGVIASLLKMQGQTFPNKIDLSGDRRGFPHEPHSDGYIRSKNDADYLTSTQAAIWQRDFLIECLFNPAWTPWHFELEGTERIRGRDLCILSKLDPPIQYANVSLRGQKELRLDRLTEEDLTELREIGALKQYE